MIKPESIEEAYPSRSMSTKEYEELENISPSVNNLGDATKLLHEYLIKQLKSQMKQNNITKNDTVSMFLSGGVDSVLLAGCLREIGISVNAFTVGTSDSPDLKSARVVAKHLGINHEEIIITEEEVLSMLQTLDEDILLSDRLTISSAILINKLLEEINNYNNNLKSKTNNNYIFTGNGADLPMGGGMKIGAGLGHADYWNYKLPQIKKIYMETDPVNLYGRLGHQYGFWFCMPFEKLEYLKLVKSLDVSLLFSKDGKDKQVIRKLVQEMQLPEQDRKKDMFQNSAGILRVVTRAQRGW